MKFDKSALKQEMLKLAQGHLAYNEHAYAEYLRGARHDRSEAADHQKLSQEAESSDMAQLFECPLHEHSKAIATLQSIDFGPKTTVEPGALVKMDDRWYAVAVASQGFKHQGVPFLGISTEAPIYQALRGHSAGAMIDFRGRQFEVQEVL